jgi:hypothetical protein
MRAEINAARLSVLVGCVMNALVLSSKVSSAVGSRFFLGALFFGSVSILIAMSFDIWGGKWRETPGSHCPLVLINSAVDIA